MSIDQQAPDKQTQQLGERVRENVCSASRLIRTPTTVKTITRLLCKFLLQNVLFCLGGDKKERAR
jgi:hypothetical protein